MAVPQEYVDTHSTRRLVQFGLYTILPSPILHGLWHKGGGGGGGGAYLAQGPGDIFEQGGVLGGGGGETRGIDPPKKL